MRLSKLNFRASAVDGVLLHPVKAATREQKFRLVEPNQFRTHLAAVQLPVHRDQLDLFIFSLTRPLLRSLLRNMHLAKLELLHFS